MTMDESRKNPFEFTIPDMSDEVQLDVSDAADFCVREEILICGPRLILPAVCWKTGVTEDLVPLQFQIPRASFRLQSGSVSVSTFVSRQQKQYEERRLLRLSLAGILGTLMWVMPLMWNWSGLSTAGILWGAILMLTGGIVAVPASLRMVAGAPVVQGYRAPGLHFVRGVPPVLLAQLRLLQAQRRQRAARSV